MPKHVINFKLVTVAIKLSIHVAVPYSSHLEYQHPIHTRSEKKTELTVSAHPVDNKYRQNDIIAN